jgi:hypothetical protein
MTAEYLSELVIAQGPRAGSLRVHIPPFAAALADRGYAKSTSKEQVRLAAEFGRWLDQKGVLIAVLGAPAPARAGDTEPPHDRAAPADGPARIRCRSADRRRGRADRC